MQKSYLIDENPRRQLSRRALFKAMGGSVAGLMLAACAPAMTPSTQPAEEITGGAAPVSETLSVELWTGFGQGRMADAMSGAVERFEQEYEQYQVSHVVVPWGDIGDTVVAAIAAGNPPDSYRGWAWMVGEYAPIGGLTALDDYLEVENVDLSDFWEPTLEQMKYQGQIFGMSISTMVDLLYYNKDILREEGFDPEDLPETLDGWEEIGHTLTEVSGGNLERIGFVPFIPVYDTLGWGAAHGASFWNADTQTVTADDPAIIRVFEWFKSYGERYGAEQIQSFITSYGGNNFGRNTPQGAYYTGLLAIWSLPTWLVNDMHEYGPDVDFGVTIVPSPSDVTTGRPGKLIANMYFVPHGASNPEGGFAFANFMSSSPWVALNKAVPDSVTPSRRSLATLPEVEDAAPWIPQARDHILPNAYPQPSMPAINFYIQMLTEGAQDVLFNNADPQAVLSDITERVQREVERRLGQ